MIFVGNRGCVQIFTGVVEKLMPMKGWLNIFNPAFTLHLLEGAIAESGSRANRRLTGMSPAGAVCRRRHADCPVVRPAERGEPEQSQWRSQIDALTAKGLAA